MDHNEKILNILGGQVQNEKYEYNDLSNSSNTLDFANKKKLMDTLNEAMETSSILDSINIDSED